jgi:hypothetical protein
MFRCFANGEAKDFSPGSRTRNAVRFDDNRRIIHHKGRGDHRAFCNKTLGGLRVSAAQTQGLQPGSRVGVSFRVSMCHHVFLFFQRQHGEVSRDQTADAESGG